MMINGDDYKREVSIDINPSEGVLYAKIIDIEEKIARLDDPGLAPDKRKILGKSKAMVTLVKESIKPRRWFRALVPFSNKNSSLFWRLLHRVDEDMLLLIPDADLMANAVDIMTYFDLNIAEEKIRNVWLGTAQTPGELIETIEAIKHEPSDMDNRYIFRQALRILNDHLDDTSLKLASNTLISVASGALLGLFMLIFFAIQKDFLFDMQIRIDVISIGMLGLIGAFLSNLLTNEDYVFPSGAFWRHVFYYTISKPVMSAFAAVFVFFIEKSKLIFTIVAAESGQPGQQSGQLSQLISLNVPKSAEDYVYVILAIASGFSADKILRGMIDKALKRLEEKAEKAKKHRKTLRKKELSRINC
jgi:hypothetical protein